MLFDEDNERVLQQMRNNGDDLSRPRVIDFTVVLPNEKTARSFGGHFDALGLEVYAERTETAPDLPWDVVVKKHMLPTNDGITGFEQELQAVATPLGGRNDGWGCFEV